MVGAERQKQNDRDGNADEPQQSRTHDNSLHSSAHPARQWFDGATVPSVEDGCGRALRVMLTPPQQRGTDHNRGGIENDYDNQPAQQLERHRLYDEGRHKHSRNPSDRQTEDDPEVDLPDLDMADTGSGAGYRRAAGHDRKGEPRVHAHQAKHHEARREIANAKVEQNPKEEVPD